MRRVVSRLLTGHVKKVPASSKLNCVASSIPGLNFAISNITIDGSITALALIHINLGPQGTFSQQDSLILTHHGVSDRLSHWYQP